MNRNGAKHLNNSVYEIESFLSGNTMGRKVIYLDSIGSTNNYARENIDKLESGTVILAEKQTAGKGRRGRGWISPRGTGIWMSIVLKPEIPPEESTKMTQIGAAAVCKSIREFTKLDALIKWPNDIVVNGKKVCGILTEMAAGPSGINYIVVGIGINVNMGYLPDDIEKNATSLFIESGKKIDCTGLLISVLKNFEILYEDYIKDLSMDKTLSIVRNHSALLGRKIRIVQGKSEKRGTAVHINEDGLLLVELEDGSRETVSSGQVSVRGEKGYV